TKRSKFHVTKQTFTTTSHSHTQLHHYTIRTKELEKPTTLHSDFAESQALPSGREIETQQRKKAKSQSKDPPTTQAGKCN
ncbi:hypothetical protein BKA82DRAFT_1008349, partial [Pisolithus tinctorius]